MKSFEHPTNVNGIISINGTAWGQCFDHYTLEYGSGQIPDSWITIINSTVPIQDGILASLDTTELDEGYYILRLRLICSNNTYEESIWMIINNECNTYIVDGEGGPGVDYITIQDAIDDAGHGDSIYVNTGTYHERVFIRKTINLIGENKNTAVIDGDGSGSVVSIYANGVNISGFTIKNSSTYGTGVRIHSFYPPAHYTDIYENILTDNGNGISISGSWSENSSYNHIFRNNIIGNRFSGIKLVIADHNTISDNIITDNAEEGIFFYTFSRNNIISKNTIINNHDGILINDLTLTGFNNNNTIACNTIENNSFGIYVKPTAYQSNDNIFYHNNFNNNIQNAYDEYNNTWDNDYPSGGNYWDTYTGVDENQDGIGDTPYNISGGNNQDRYPLMEPYVVDTNPPLITIMTPQKGMIHIADMIHLQRIFSDKPLIFGKVTIFVNASDDQSDIHHVEFYIDDVFQENISNEPYAWLWSESSFSSHEIKVIAYDNVGNCASRGLTVWKFF